MKPNRRAPKVAQFAGIPGSFGLESVTHFIGIRTQGSRLAQSVDAALAKLGLAVLSARTSRRVAYEEAGGLGLTVMDLSERDKAAHETMT